MADRVRIVARGPLGMGTEVHLLDEQGNPRSCDLPVRSIQIDPITPDGLLVARIEVPVDELEVEAELAPPVPDEAQVSKLHLEPGDSIVLRYQGLLRPELQVRLRQQLAELWPGHRVVVLDRGLELGIVREVPASPTPAAAEPAAAPGEE